MAVRLSTSTFRTYNDISAMHCIYNVYFIVTTQGLLWMAVLELNQIKTEMHRRYRLQVTASVR